MTRGTGKCALPATSMWQGRHVRARMGMVIWGANSERVGANKVRGARRLPRKAGVLIDTTLRFRQNTRLQTTPEDRQRSEAVVRSRPANSHVPLYGLPTLMLQCHCEWRSTSMGRSSGRAARTGHATHAGVG